MTFTTALLSLFCCSFVVVVVVGFLLGGIMKKVGKTKKKPQTTHKKRYSARSRGKSVSYFFTEISAGFIVGDYCCHFAH